MSITVQAPATAANLGPGFDALGLALELRDEIAATTAPFGVEVDVVGEGADTAPRDENNLVVQAMRAGFDVHGWHPPGLRLRCTNRIPHGRGLGSSAAAIVGGLLAARALVPDALADERKSDAELLDVAVRLEGHRDNVAPCLLGGALVMWADDDEPGTTRVVRLPVVAEIHPVLFVPSTELSTAKARELLPAQVPHADATATAGRAALLSYALTQAPEYLLPATRDWLHQDYRAPAIPESAALVQELRSNGIPAVISGAGPSVLAFVTGDASATGDPSALLRWVPPGFRVMALPLARDGARVATPESR